MAIPVIYTAGDSQDHLAALLQGDDLFRSAFPDLPRIRRTDPGGVDGAVAGGVDVALAVATEGSGPGGTLGDAGAGGSDEERVTLVLLVYVFSEQRDEARDRRCVDLTGYARAALKRYMADKTPGLQLWHGLTFGAPGRADASAYIYQDGYYLSITPVNLMSRPTRR